jgi:hypothetical protein
MEWAWLKLTCFVRFGTYVYVCLKGLDTSDSNLSNRAMFDHTPTAHMR